MKKKIVFWVITAIAVITCAAFMTGCTTVVTTEKGSKLTPNVGVITSIDVCRDDSTLIEYNYEQKGIDWNYSGTFVAKNGLYKLHDSIYFSADVTAEDETKSE